ncbi:hypothetical protein [Caulifigura coniformis]|uniref:hypothetical protein n=1 Tax=Caulifigura coniformis TaxID=2527983 RepID=UPI0011AA54F9|nr:hypothetical protein [Caulifigura coniformis]
MKEVHHGGTEDAEKREIAAWEACPGLVERGDFDTKASFIGSRRWKNGLCDPDKTLRVVVVMIEVVTDASATTFEGEEFRAELDFYPRDLPCLRALRVSVVNRAFQE